MKKSLFAIALTVVCAGCLLDGVHTPEENTTDDDRASLKKAYVITVGVENGYAGKCAGAKTDCNHMASLLKPYAKTLVKLVDKQATITAVCNALKTGAKSDLLIFYFSGHGGQVNTAQAANDPTEADKKDEFICLYDGGLLDNSIWNIISTCKGRVVLIFDACHSQTMYREPVTFSRQIAQARDKHHVAGNLRMICWSGCPDNSYSYGSSSGGVFTNAIRKYFNKKLTYDQLWSKLESYKTLTKQEKIQCTTMGTKFGTTKVFQ